MECTEQCKGWLTPSGSGCYRSGGRKQLASNRQSRQSWRHQTAALTAVVPRLRGSAARCSNLRSSSRGTPLGVLGNTGWMIDHSKSDSRYRRGSIAAPPATLNHPAPRQATDEDLEWAVRIALQGGRRVRSSRNEWRPPNPKLAARLRSAPNPGQNFLTRPSCQCPVAKQSDFCPGCRLHQGRSTYQWDSWRAREDSNS
jgi:hypothetical protein